MTESHHICDYSDTDYKRDFWGKGGRDYEDMVERLALRRLLPDSIGRFLDLGGGFGRLMDEYAPRCTSAVLVDYAPNLVEQARQRADELHLSNVSVFRGDLYDLSFLESTFDGCMMVRVLHHVESVDALLGQVRNKLEPGGFFILEYANKRNLLEIARWLVGRSGLRPFRREPGRRGQGVYFNFHPRWVEDRLRANGFAVERVLMASVFRNAVLKRVFGARFLARMEGMIQGPLGRLRLSPSVFVLARRLP